MLAAKTKCKLNTIVMKSNESVNEYYYWLFKLWKDANTLTNECIKKFKLTLRLNVSYMLLAEKYNSLCKL